MPLGQQRLTSRQSPTADPRTAIFHSNPTTRPPPYKVNQASDPRKPNLFVSSGRDLCYLHALASGECLAIETTFSGATQPALALHLFRGTKTHLFPVAERLALGVDIGAPYYSSIATPSTLNAFEYNTLVVSRRHPLSHASDDVCVANIRPCLNLFTPGIWEVGNISRTAHGVKVPNEEYVLTWSGGTNEPLGGSWCLWQEGRAVARFYGGGGFQDLDQVPRKGFIRVISSIPPCATVANFSP